MVPDRNDSRDGLEDRRSLVRWEWAGVLLFALLVSAFPLYRAVEATRRADTLVQREAALVSLGADIWEQNCASCHGARGEGEPGIPALNSQEFLKDATDEQIHHITAAGVPGTEMTAWWVEFGGALTDEQVRASVALIRSWQPTAPSREDWRDPQPSEAMHHEGQPEPGQPPPAGEQVALLVIDDNSCQPLEIDVPADEPFTLQIRNDGDARFSFELASQEVHTHVPIGDTVELEFTLGEGEYQFECLGSSHDQLLGIGYLRAQQPSDAQPPVGEQVPLLVIDDNSCQPLDIDVPADEPFTLQIRNDGDARFSFELASQEVHTHVPIGDTVELEFTLGEGEYQFECLGSSHDQLLGIGYLRAQQPSDAQPPAGEQVPLLVIDDNSCQPLEIDVPADEPFTLQIRNDGDARFSFELASQEVHTHVPIGDTVELEFTLGEGEYQFECLGSSHDQLLGIGYLRAR